MAQMTFVNETGRPSIYTFVKCTKVDTAVVRVITRQTATANYYREAEIALVQDNKLRLTAFGPERIEIVEEVS